MFDDLIGDDSPDVGEDLDYQHYHSLRQDALEKMSAAPLTLDLDEEAPTDAAHHRRFPP
ncbi:hypothetical protein M8494_27920 [Serratia ureilytica]